MSPEVAEKRPYNQGADVFSFGMVLFEILSLTRPTLTQEDQYVDTSRLPMCPCWPDIHTTSSSPVLVTCYQ